jgi:glycosyltransferase involved in cell wall biosynthesis
VTYRLNDTGGAEWSTVLLIEQLVEAEIDVRVLLLSEECSFASRARLEAAGVHFITCPGGSLARARRVIRDVRRTRPDLVGTTLFEPDMVGRIAAALAGVPAVVTLANMQYSPEAFEAIRSPRRLEAVRRIDATFGRHLTTAFHAVSHAVARQAVELHGATPERVVVVHRGRDLATYAHDPTAGAAVRRELGIEPDVPVLLNIARQEPQKGQDLLLDAFVRVHERRPHAVLLVAGREGNSTAALHAQAERLGFGDAVRFLGVRNDIPALLSAADVMVASSRWEGVAGAVLEAMVAEVPVAGFGIEPVREVTAGHAALVPLGDTEGLGRELLALLDDPDRRRTLAAEAHRHAVATFSLDGYGDAMAALYRAVIDDPERYPRPALTRAMARLRGNRTRARG